MGLNRKYSTLRKKNKQNEAEGKWFIRGTPCTSKRLGSYYKLKLNQTHEMFFLQS